MPMGIWLSIPITILVYILTFSKDYQEEHLNKATPFIIGLIAIPVVLGLLGSLSG